MPTEQQAPEQIKPESLDDHLEVLSKSVFQAGMSWRVVDSKWPGIKEALNNFQIGAVASLGEEQIDGLADDTRMIRNRSKIAGTAHNARTLIELDEEYDGIVNYFRSFDDFWDLVKDVRKRFKFLGNMGVFLWMYVIGEKVPPYEEYQKVAATKK